MMKSIDYGSYNTWKDWGLVLVDSSIGSAEVMETYEEAKTTDGIVDQTEQLGGPYYGIRPISHTFQTRQKIKGISRGRLLFMIENAIHGKRMEIKEHGDSYHWTGRVFTEFELEDDGSMTVTINAECEPYQKNSSGSRRL